MPAPLASMLQSFHHARLLAAGLAFVILSAPLSPAMANDAREYFVARVNDSAVPRLLDQNEAAYYDGVFRAIEAQQWALADALLGERSAGLLHDVARAELYLAAGSPRVEFYQIDQWLATGRNLPQAEQLSRLALTRGATATPALPMQRDLIPRAPVSKRLRPPSVNDGTMPPEIRAAILERITNDDPDGARVLLGGVDALLSPEARAEWRQRVAWSYYIENQDRASLALARTVAQGSGAWVAEGEWVAGLAAWRLGDCAGAGEGFERAAYHAINPELRAAALYWASRAAQRCRRPDVATQHLVSAAASDETLYGMLAAEKLGRALPDRLAGADLTREDWQRLGRHENIRITAALAQIGRDVLASEVLLHQARIGDPEEYATLSRLARELGFPQTQLFMAHNAPRGGNAHPASNYPAPRWTPVTGWRVDPALAYAHALQESNFRASAVSPADARGLMQITPITIREHAPRLAMNAATVNIFDPATNLAFGQRNLEMLRDHPATGGALPKIIAAYNAGLTPVTRWNGEIRDQGDPLLYMESIPYWETREYVAIVTRNYWMYERQAGAANSVTRVALAQNRWPSFPGASAAQDRAFMSGAR